MFKFLKEKLKNAISKISESVEREGNVDEKTFERPKETLRPEERGFFVKLKDKLAGKEELKPVIEEKKDEIKVAAKVEPHIIAHKKYDINIEQKKKGEIQNTKEFPKAIDTVPSVKKHEEKIIRHAEHHRPEPKAEIKEESKKHEIRETLKQIEVEPVKKGFFETIKEKITTTQINEQQFEKLFMELGLALMENNVAVEVIEKIKNDLKGNLVEKPIRRTKVEETIQETLKGSITDLFEYNDLDLIEEIENKKDKPYVIAFFGINGSGKTTSIAKIARMLIEKKISCVLAASDTFRAASIEQLQLHADNIGVKLIKHTYGSDPAAVAFDAVRHAKAKGIDVVLIDTAGRMHSNTNLIDELKKITRVTKPDLKIFVGESITGNDCVEQAKTFNESVGIDGIILAKADIDEKGGAAVSVSYVTKKPILFLGTGQKYGDLEEFHSSVILENLGLA